MDSINEVAINAYNAATGQCLMRTAELPGSYLTVFRRNRYIVQKAGEFIPFANWCISTTQDALINSSDYAALIAPYKSEIAELGQLFYQTREKPRSLDIQSWIDLHQPYEPIFSQLKDGSGPIFIITNKDKISAEILLCYFGLEKERLQIFSGDHGKTKADNILAAREVIGRHSRLLFIDDSIKNLLELQASPALGKLKLELFLAAWGYIGPNDVAQASENQIETMTLAELPEIYLTSIASNTKQ